jgi:hypothetical protein
MFASQEGRDLMQGLEETGRILATEFNHLDEAMTAASPEPEEWSVKQNIAHISEIEPGLVDEAVVIAAQPGALIGHPPGALWGEAQHTANGRPLAELVREFEVVNRDTLARVAVLTDEDLTRTGTHRGSGMVTVYGALMVALGHRRGHIFQNRSNLISLRAQQEGRVPPEAYTMTGNGGPALLLLDATVSKWDPVIAALGSRYRIIHYKFAALPPTIEQLRRDLDLRTLWIAGTAAGAIDACKYAFAHPEHVAGLVLVNLPILPFSRDGRPDDFGRITAPTLTLVGENHPQAVPAQERGRQFPSGRVVVMAGAGRDVPREQPAAVAEAIRRFVPLSVGA